MKLAIIGAMHKEIEFLVSQIKNVSINQYGNYSFYEGNLFEHDVVIVESGVGKVMAGILISTLINYYPNVEKIINIGVAGGYNNLNICDIIVGEYMVMGDFDVSCFDDYRVGQMGDFPFLFEGDKYLVNKCLELNAINGTIYTSDSFIYDYSYIENRINKYFNDLDIKCFDMETTAFAQGCYFYKKDFIAIRAISDVIGNPEKKYNNNVIDACKASNDFLIKLLRKL